MKSYGLIYRKIYPYLGPMERIGFVSLSIFSLILGANKEADWLKNRPIVLRGMEFLENYAIFFLSLSMILIALGFLIKCRGNPWVWDKIKFILDEYQGKAFNVDPSDPRDHHRVTLFKHYKNCIFRRHWSSRAWWKPWGETPMVSSYLAPVLRSGHISQKSSALFHVPDDSDKAEGVAGKAWSAQEAIILPSLPDVNKANAKVRDRKNYANVTSCDIDMVNYYREKKRPLPRSVAAIPIEVKGKPWGVVVLDSRVENGVQEDSVLNYSLTVALLGQLLEKA